MIDSPEFEAKFYISIADARAKLKSAGATLISPERLMRRAIIDEAFHPEFKCDFIRVRDEGDKITLSAKTHSKTGKMEDEKEIELKVDSYDKALHIFAAINLIPDKYQETKRESWELDGCKIDIDTWPGLDPYIEIEGESEKLIKSVAEKLGLYWPDHFVSNSISMYSKVYGIPVSKVHELTTHLTFAHNPFAALPKKSS